MANGKWTPAKYRAEGKRQLRRIGRLNKVRGLAQLKSMDPIVFEYMVGALFEQRGYSVRYTKASADEGVDLILRKRLRKIVVQCKRYDGSVGQPTVRDLYGTMMHTKSNEAYLVTTATVTGQAQNWARGKPIRLVDGFTLVNWIAQTRNPLNLNLGAWLWPGLIALVLIWGFGFEGFSSAWSLLPDMPLPSDSTLRENVLYFPIVAR